MRLFTIKMSDHPMADSHHRIGCAFAALLVLSTPAHAATRHINAAGTGDAPTIQAAVDMSANGDSVILADGIYTGPGNRQITIGDKYVFVASETGNASNCIIDCQDQWQCFLFNQIHLPTERLALSLEGVTIARAFTSSSFEGAAIECVERGATIKRCRFIDCSPRAIHDDQGYQWYFEDCVFEGNGVGVSFHKWTGSFTFLRCSFVGNLLGLHAGESGPGLIQECVFAGNSGGALETTFSAQDVRDCTFTDNHNRTLMIWTDQSTFLRCRFENNSGDEGGVAWVSEGGPVFDTCTFVGNTALLSGGAIFSRFGVVTLKNSLLADNTAPSGGCLYGEAFDLTNCTVYGNSSLPSSAAIYVADGSHVSLTRTIVAWSTGGGAVGCDATSSAVATCSNLFGNAGGDWVGCLAGQVGTNGNIAANPYFCNAGHGDFHLSGLSPCLNAPCGTMGAYGQGCSWPVAVGDDGEAHRFALHQNVPNPFNPVTIIDYDVPSGGAFGALEIFDVTGRHIRTLVRGSLSPGRQSVRWNGIDDNGAEAASGVYFCRFTAGSFRETKKMLLVR